MAKPLLDPVEAALEHLRRQDGGTSGPLAEEAAALAGDMAAFVRAAWPIVSPRVPLVWGWHIDCLIEHMQAVMRGDIRTLLINIPPGHFKTSSVGVMLHPWAWATQPQARFLTGSYGMVQATKAAASSRRIIESDWYAARWPEVVMRPDQNAKSRYENTLGGARYSFSTGGVVTGDHATVLLWDDPLKAADALSPTKRETAIEFLTETLPSRFEDPMNATMIIMGQRLHERDPSGYLLAEQLEQKDPSFVPVILPAHYDPSRACRTRWFRDPRKETGELLWPERFNEAALRARTRHMTDRARSAQYEQDPTAGAGGIIKAKDWRIWPQRLPQFEQIMITFDPAMVDGDDTSYWACGVWGMFTPASCWDVAQGEPPADLPDTQAIMLIEAWRKRSGYYDAKRGLLATIDTWTVEGEPPNYIVIEEKAAGALLVEELTRAGMRGLCPYLPSKSKTERAEIASSLWQFGLVWAPGKKLGDGRRSSLVVTEWAQPVLDECQAFPHADTDDYLDISTMAALFARQSGQVTLEDDWRDLLEGKGPKIRKRRVAAYG